MYKDMEWKWIVWAAYKDPEEECNLKGILKQDKVYQIEDNSWPVEPKVIIWRHNYQIPFNCRMFFSNLVSQLSNDMLQFSANSKQNLQKTNKVAILLSCISEQ